MVEPEDLETWLKIGAKNGATHVIVRSTAEGATYPEYVLPGQDLKAAARAGDRDRALDTYPVQRRPKHLVPSS